MATLVVLFAEKVLKRDYLLDDETCVVTVFADSEQWDREAQDTIKKICSLGVMGKVANKKFRFDDLVTRAEFATIMSRLLYGNRYETL